MEPFPPVDVEKEFGTVVRSFGGVVLSDELEGSPSFKNADYVFHRQKVVAELKCLTKDNLHSAESEKRLGDLWQRWKAAGRVQDDAVSASNWEQLPRELQEQFFKIASRPIVKRVQKANTQIRETRERLNLSDYTGLLLLVNDGKSSFSPAATINAVVIGLQSSFRQISDFVFFTVNQFSLTREMPVPTLFWFSISREDETPPERKAFLETLGRDWRNHHCSLLGKTGVAKEIQDMEGFWHSRYTHPS